MESKRLQQQDIPSLALDLLDQYGRSEYSESKGGKVHYFDKRGLKKANKAIEQLVACADKLDGIYCVEAVTGVVITTGHRIRPIQRDYHPRRRRISSQRRASYRRRTGRR